MEELTKDVEKLNVGTVKVEKSKGEKSEEPVKSEEPRKSAASEQNQHSNDSKSKDTDKTDKPSRDVYKGSSAVGKDEKGSGSNPPSKGKRYESNRRDNWKRNERKYDQYDQKGSCQEGTRYGHGSSERESGKLTKPNSRGGKDFKGKDYRDRDYKDYDSADRDSYSRDSKHSDYKEREFKERYDSKKDGRKPPGKSKSDCQQPTTGTDSRERDSERIDHSSQSGEKNAKGDSRGEQRERTGKSYRESRTRAGSRGQASRGQGDCQPVKDKGKSAENAKNETKKEESGRDISKKDKPNLENINSGADLLNMLHKNTPKPNKTKSRDRSKLSASDLEAQWQKEEEEKRKAEEAARKAEEDRLRAEEEAKRLEEERRLAEEERKRQKEEEEKRIQEEELKQITEFLAEMKEREETKSSLRAINLAAADHRPDDAFFSKLDSSLKKNTAFVKKLKNLTELQKDTLAKEFASLNLSKYVGEAAAAITEAKLKMSDIGCALHICSLMHQRYADFSSILLENWNKVLPSKKDEKAANPSKLRVDLRLFAELVAVGVFVDKVGLSILANQLTYLISGDKEEHNNLSILLSFCKHCGDDYAGLIPAKFRLLAEKYGKEIPRSTFLPAERQKACRNLLKEYYSSLCKHVLKDHKELKSMEKHNRKILQTKGELSSERKEKYEAAQQSFQKLLANTASFSDIMNEDMPELPEEEIQNDPDAIDIFNPLKNAEYQYEGDMTLFEDEDTRAFYENLPDLKAFIPGILYKDSEQSGASGRSQTSQETPMEEEIEILNVEDVEKEMELEAKLEAVEEEEAKGSGDGKEECPPILDDTDVTQEGKNWQRWFSRNTYDGDDLASSLRLILDNFIQTLPQCVNREIIDKAAVDFCMNLNTKANRKKLVRALFTVHRTRYDLLPFYSRLVATLHPCMPDIAADLGAALKSDFKWHVRKKDQINIESKLKTVRFIGELVKFNMFAKSEALHCMKMLLFDFTHHNIEMACALLDSCGRFLYRSSDSHHRTKVYLDVMMRKKSALHLDSRYTTMIENAYYYSNPPEVKNEARKERPPIHQYIRKFLYKDLSKVTTEKVLRQIRKLDWDDTEIVAYTTKCLTAIWNVRYNSIHCMANLLAGLTPYHEQVAIQVVDGVLEDIRLGMEINHPKYNQRRVSTAKYLGELYNYRMVESSVIFKTLYSFITFGVALDESVPCPLDPPEHLFRIRLVCVILDTCGQYFDRGSSKKKLDCFLVYFQRYYWFKKSLSVWLEENTPFPIGVEYMLRDTLDALRPKLALAENYEQACKATEELDSEFRTKLAEFIPVEGEEEEEEEDGRSLRPIRESDEMDELSQNLSLSGAANTDDQSTQDSELGMESNSQTGSQTGSQSFSQSQGHSQNREDDEEGEQVMMSAGEEEEDDQITLLTGGPKHINCAEDEDFMSAFDKMMVETISARTHESVKVPQLDIAVPMHLRGQKKVYANHTEPEPEPESYEDGTINFVLMTKKGNKQQFTTLNVPITEEFAHKYKEREQAERAEKERMKRVVLDIHERQEEEDYQEMLAGLQRAGPTNTNRERRLRYQHPKGAPDADLIFGSK